MLRIILLTIIISLISVHAAQGSTDTYKKSLKKWTRGDQVYRAEDLQAIVQWNATLLDDSMLQAQATHYAKAYEISEAEKKQKLEERKKKKGNEVLVFVSFYSGDRHFDDLTDERAKWDLRLMAGGVTFRPTRIEKISKRPTPLDVFYFPYLNEWSRGYYVWFSPEALFYPRPWILSVHGPNAKSELTWK